VTTHIFDSASKYLDSDTVFGVKGSLIRDFVPRDVPTSQSGPWCVVENDFVLHPS
jgi:hypothetical protein